MNDYDFRQLSDKEFEVFCCDLLSSALSMRFERFKPGRDEGVDGRYFSDTGEVILQCKHWLNTPLNQLFGSLKNNEKSKVDKLRPDRYLLAISHPLSRTDKKKLVEIFAPHIKSPDDIFGKEDLNDILAKNQEIERRHYKLWLASSNVISSILNASIYGRSDFLIKDIVDESPRYVITQNHDKAIEKLEEKHVVIITGEAGIGKTTLARNILIPYLSEGYELFSIGDDISEAEGVFRKDQKQIFYFDDFLGSNYLDAISGNAGAHIALFIKRIKTDKLKRFVLTSRTTILNQGKILIGALADQNTSKDEFEISLQSLSRLDKAKILYNHIWHSSLDDEFKEEIYKEKRYRSVVDHKNYNPRIVSYVTDVQRLDHIKSADYWTHIVGMLENPADVWSHPFDAQHDDYGKSLVLLVALNGRPITQKELSEAYYRYISRSTFSSMRGQRDFLLNLRHLCGSMLNRVVYGTHEYLTLFNPSIRDFVISRFRKDLQTLKSIFLALRTEDSISATNGMMLTDFIDEIFVRELWQSVAREADLADYVNYSSAYIARLYISLKDLLDPDFIRNQLPIKNATEFVECEDLPHAFEEVLDFYIFSKQNGSNSPQFLRKLVTQASAREPNYHELEKLAKIIRNSDYDEETSDIFIKAVSLYFSEQIYEEFPAEDVFEGLPWDEDWWEAKLKLKDMIRNRLDVFGLSENEEMIDDIADNYDLDDQAQGYFMGHEEISTDTRGSRIIDVTDDIDDLFDRS